MNDSAVKPVNKSRLVDQITEQIRRLIFSKDLAPGSSLIQEELAEKLGVSRTPLREAFRILERDGLIQSSTTNGTAKVAEFDDQDIAELYDVREVLDGLAARLAATRGLDPKDAVRFQLQVDEIAAAAEPFNLRRFVEVHSAYHLGIVEAAGNKHLQNLTPVVRISTHMLFARFGDNTARVSESVAEHQDILQAILNKDPVHAEHLARKHIQSARQNWHG